MISDKIDEIKRICDFICWEERVSGSKGNKKVRNFIKKYLKENGFRFYTEKFEVNKVLPVRAEVRTEEKIYYGIPLVGSLWGEVSGTVKLVHDLGNENLKGKIVATPVGKLRDSEKAKILREKKASALITFLEELDLYYIGTIGEVKFPAINMKREDIKEIEGKEVVINIRTERKTIEGENIIVEFGRGPYVYLIAHYDTKPFVYGAIDNGLSVALLLVLIKDLRNYEDLPFRIRVLFTDCEEIGLEGSYYHVRNMNIKNILYVINIDSIGWKNPAVLYKDCYGENGVRINEKFLKHVNDVKANIPFVESKTGSSDHVPFKEKGIETLFLSSNPFTFRHTELDDFYAIDWETVKMWYEIISHFIRRLHRL